MTNHFVSINIFHLSNVHLHQYRIRNLKILSRFNTSRYLIYHRANANLTKEERKSRKEQGSTLVEKEKDEGRKLTRKATREGEDEEKVGS